MKKTLYFLLFLIPNFLHAEISVLFHPEDKTLINIADLIKNAKTEVDMALYNIDVSKENPIIQTISSDSVQNRIKQGTLKLRMIYEGYESKEAKEQNIQKLKDLGILVRTMTGLNMHHKFGIFDGHGDDPKVVTGSANWSLSSQNNYNENVLFISKRPDLAKIFLNEFEYLWCISVMPEDKADKSKTCSPVDKKTYMSDDAEIVFNSDNFNYSNGKFNKITPLKWTITKGLVNLISNANGDISIATTRFKLRPVYKAITEAAKRGVKIKIILGMDDFVFPEGRSQTLPDCPDEWNSDCSVNIHYWQFLSGLPASSNIEVRFKWYNYKQSAYLSSQMHNKYIIINGKTVGTGAFNWSFSSEYGHLENFLILKNDSNKTLLNSYISNFNKIWEMNRDQFTAFISALKKKEGQKDKIPCSFKPMIISPVELDTFYELLRQNETENLKACE